VTWVRLGGKCIYTIPGYNFSHFAIYLPEFIKIHGNMTKFWQKQKCTVCFWDTVYMCVCVYLVMNGLICWNCQSFTGVSIRVAGDSHSVILNVCQYYPVIYVPHICGTLMTCRPTHELVVRNSIWGKMIQPEPIPTYLTVIPQIMSIHRNI